MSKLKIANMTYLKPEYPITTETVKKSIFDLYYENNKGEKLIVELQKSK